YRRGRARPRPHCRKRLVAPSGDAYYSFLGAAVGPELLLELPLQLARSLELLDDVRAADQLAANKDLRDRRPARERRQLLADLRVGQDVDGSHRRAGPAQRIKRPLGVAAHHELWRAL